MILTAIGALVFQFLVAVVKAAGANALAVEAAKQKEKDDAMQKEYDRIGRARHDDVSTGRVLDDGKF